MMLISAIPLNFSKTQGYSPRFRARAFTRRQVREFVLSWVTTLYWLLHKLTKGSCFFNDILLTFIYFLYVLDLDQKVAVDQAEPFSKLTLEDVLGGDDFHLAEPEPAMLMEGEEMVSVMN